MRTVLLAFFVFSSQADTGPTVERFAYWADAPTVVVCPDAPVTIKAARAIVKAYQSDCNRVGKVRLARGDECEDEVQYGNIYIVQLPPDYAAFKDLVGETRYLGDQGWLTGAVIGMLANNAVVLDHEMGHALGYSHANGPSHVMSPALDVVGTSRQGMEQCDE